MKIAVIRFSALGDIAASLPILRALKYQPVIITTQVGRELLKDEFDDFIILKSKKIIDVFKIILEIRKYKFDYLIDLQTNDRSKLITGFSKARNVFNSHKVNKSQQVTQIFFDVVNQINPKVIDPMDYTFTKKDKTYIVLNCGSSPKWHSKRLPYEKWREISEILYEKFKLPFYLTGDKSEIEYVENLSKFIVGDKKNLSGKTDIQELKEVLKNAYLTISTDSASMHISAVEKTPTIGLFGPTNWIVSAPFGTWSTVVYDKTYFKEEIPLEKNSQEINNYFDYISIDDALKQLKEYLK